jgi:uncharacterized protein (TIGR00290 family)
MKAFMNWSGGKDSALALWHARLQDINVQALLTSVNHVHDRISMHGVRRSLLQAQATSLQLPLHTIELPEQPDMKEYEEKVSIVCDSFKKDGFSHAIFGDIFLQGLRDYRETQLARKNIKVIFPIWKIDSKDLVDEFISLGFKAVIVCVNTKFLDKSFCGRLIDQSFVNDLPSAVDPCGENGEFHSFVFDGPIFRSPIEFNKGEIVYKEYKAPLDENRECHTTRHPVTGFHFIDLLPASTSFNEF